MMREAQFKNLNRIRGEQGLEEASQQELARYLSRPATRNEIARLVDITRAIGARDLLLTEDHPELQLTAAKTEEAQVLDSVRSLDECFRQLPLPQKVALRLSAAGLTVPVIANILGVSTKAVYRYLAAARAKLADHLLNR